MRLARLQSRAKFNCLDGPPPSLTIDFLERLHFLEQASDLNLKKSWLKTHTRHQREPERGWQRRRTNRLINVKMALEHSILGKRASQQMKI